MLADPETENLVGSPTPRIAPPLPLRHGLKEYRVQARALGIEPMPWQETAAKYATAVDGAGRWTYREVAIVVGRQNGKTTLSKPLIVGRLKAGRHIMHIAQVRELPRIMFEQIADALEATAPGLFPTRRGKIIWPRRGGGSESIVLANGGSYRIAAAVSGSARGHSIDDLLIDELREMDSFDVINSAKPAQRFSDNPQTIYLSNAGTETSMVLNSLRTRGPLDPSLAYLEWSADPSYDADDRRGWVQSNPAVGPEYPQVLRDLETDYVAAKLGGNLAGFETEALCRWVPSMRERLVDEYAWMACQGPLGDPIRPVMAVSMTPDGKRAAAAMAWQRPDSSVALRLLYNVTGDPIDTAELGADMDRDAKRLGIKRTAYDPLTDAELAKYLTSKTAKPVRITGQEFANASAQFVNLVNSGRLKWTDDGSLSADLAWTSKKAHDDTGHFQAVRMSDNRPIPAALASIRAVWLASGPTPPSPRVY